MFFEKMDHFSLQYEPPTSKFTMNEYLIYLYTFFGPPYLGGSTLECHEKYCSTSSSQVFMQELKHAFIPQPGVLSTSETAAGTVSLNQDYIKLRYKS